MIKGYRKFSDSLYWPFVKDLYESLYKEVKNDEEKESISTLTVTYAKMYPYTTLIHFNPDYVVDDSHYDKESMSVFSDLMSGYQQICLKDSTILDARFRVKKTTAMGFRNETVDGIPFGKDDYLYGLESDAEFVDTRFRKDLSQIKMAYFKEDHGVRRIFVEQCAAVREGIKPSKIGDYIDRNLVSVCTTATRENNPDAVFLDGVFDFTKPVYSKDRNYSVWKTTPKGSNPVLQTHQVEVGLISSKRYNEVALNIQKNARRC